MSDSEIFREVDEDYRREQMEKFWKRFGAWVALGVLVLILAVWAGTYLYQRAEDKKADQTAQLDQLITEGKPGDEAKVADALALYAGNADASHAILARLAEASLRQRIGQVEGAAKLYHGIADDSAADPDMRDLAIVRLGAIAVDQDKPEPMMAQLQTIAQKNSLWRYSAREMIALLTAKDGKRAEAAKMFDDLARDPAAPPDLVERARVLADLYRGK